MNVKPSIPRVAILHAVALLLGCLLLSLTVEAGNRFDEGLLWKIETAGVTPSYLFGTMHSDDPGVVRLPKPVQQAFNQAEAVTLEIVMDAQSLMVMTTSLLLAEGTTLKSLIGADLYKRTVEIMTRQGIPELLVSRMKPWAVAVTLMTPPSKTGVVLDLVLYQDALAQGKKVDGLETVEEQMGLFDSLSKRDQITLLKDTLDNLQLIDQMLEELHHAYLDRDLKRLVEINEQSMRDSDPQLAATFNRKVIVERNHRMAERMQTGLQAGGQFIAVGALHLPGKEGLLNLLSSRGYRVTRIY